MPIENKTPEWGKEFIKDFCEFIPYRDTELLCWKGVKEKNINLIPTARTLLQWIQETITQDRLHQKKMIRESIENISFCYPPNSEREELAQQQVKESVLSLPSLTIKEDE